MLEQQGWDGAFPKGQITTTPRTLNVVLFQVMKVLETSFDEELYK